MILLLILLLIFTPQSTLPSPLATCLLSSPLLNFSLPHFPTHPIPPSQNLRFSPSPHPSALLFPHNLPSLQSSILCSRASSLPIRIRSGGHFYETLSNSPHIALIDLLHLDRILIDPDSRTAWVQSGATLGQLYHSLSSSSPPLAFSAGSCPSVGSGGHIAGGGFGFLSRKFGLAADNILDAILVSPDGRILDRNSMGEDLFWAIRGGGGNTWGAVFSWKIQLLTVPDRVSAFIINRTPGSNRLVAGMVDAWQRMAPVLPDEFYVSCFVGAGLPESNRVGMSVTFKGLFLGPASQARVILSDRFAPVRILDWEVLEMSWIESVVFFSGLRNGSSVDDLLNRDLIPKTFFKAKSDYVKSYIGFEDLVKMVDVLSREPKAYLIMDPYGGSMGRRRKDDLPFPHRGENLYAIQHLIEWSHAEDGGREGYLRWMREWYEFIGRIVSGQPRAAYVNYIDFELGPTEASGDDVEDGRVWGEKYFLDNYDRLVRIKTEIDPENVFWHEQSIPPLTSRRRKQMGLCEMKMD